MRLMAHHRAMKVVRQARAIFRGVMEPKMSVLTNDVAPGPARTLWATGLLHVGALGILLFLLGGTWDVSWHIVIGRDTFWSPPHLLLYGGILLVLITVVATLAHAWRLRGAGLRYAGPMMRLPGGLAVNPGIVVAGLGTVMALTSAPIDNAWHAMFGLDVVIWSPPHIQLILGVAFAALGLLAGLAGEMNHADPGRLSAVPESPFGGRDILLLALGGLLVVTLSGLYAEYAFDIPPFPVWQGAAVLAATVTGALVAGARASGRRWAATGIALAQLVIAALTLAVLWITPALGAALAGLLHPDYWPSNSLLLFLPALLLPAAVTLDLWQAWFGQRLRRGSNALAGLVAAAVLVVTNALWHELWGGVSWFREMPPWGLGLAILAGALAAMLGGWIGGQLRPARLLSGLGSTERLAAATTGAVVLLILAASAAQAHGTDPEVQITLGEDHLAAGEPFEIMVWLDPHFELRGNWDTDRMMVHLERAERKITLPLERSEDWGVYKKAYQRTLMIPSAGQWSLAILLPGPDQLNYAWTLVDVGPPGQGAPVPERTLHVPIVTKDIRLPEHTWSGAFLIGKVSVTLYVLLLSTLSLLTLRLIAADARAVAAQSPAREP